MHKRNQQTREKSCGLHSSGAKEDSEKANPLPIEDLPIDLPTIIQPGVSTKLRSLLLIFVGLNLQLGQGEVKTFNLLGH